MPILRRALAAKQRGYCCQAALRFSHINATTPLPKRAAVEPVSGTVPVSENDPLKVGAGLPPTMSVPIRDQSGSRLPLRIQD